MPHLAPYRPFDQGPPELHLPGVYGASPGKPLRYRIAVSGERPLRFSVSGLPEGVTLDAARGILSGQVAQAGEYPLTLEVANARGSATGGMTLRIAPDGVARTPLMGFTTWNAFSGAVTQADMETAAQLLVDTGLADFGYQYVNLDSGWQGVYGGPHDAVLPNAKFPDMPGMVAKIHALGLKAGIYSTPMQRAWGGDNLPGCTRGMLDPAYVGVFYGVGQQHCEAGNAAQWSEWGFDYLKYDWTPCDPQNAQRMKQCLLNSPRDFAYSVTVRAGLEHAAYWREHCSSWRDNTDSTDTWENILESKFASDIWAQHIQPGHFFDMDMLETGVIRDHQSMSFRACRLTPDEQMTAYTMRALFPSPLVISCDLAQLTDFDLALLCNPEVIAVNQDPLAQGAVCVYARRQRSPSGAQLSHLRVYHRILSGGRAVVGLFNLGAEPETVPLDISPDTPARDLWMRQPCTERRLTIPPHGVRLIGLNG